MSFGAAVQSAVFYFVACTPCAQVRHRHRATQKAKKEREEKARIVAEQPHLYQHPDPFNTNPYWSEEIRMGPSLPRKGKGGGEWNSKNTSQRGLMISSRDGGASIGTGSIHAISSPAGSGPTPPAKSPTGASSPGIGRGSTVGVHDEAANAAVLSKTASVSTADDWNYKRYQREDEELWGDENSWTGQKLMDAIKQAGSSAGRFVELKLGIDKQVTDEDRRNFYSTPRNPPVNDYHPPVVSSKPVNKNGLAWMLQPPPPAKVMEGKVPVSRSGSMMSAASRRTLASQTNGRRPSLSRLVGERALDAAQMRGDEMPYEGGSNSTSSLQQMRSRKRAATTSTTRTMSRLTTRSASISSSSADESSEKEVSPHHSQQRRRRRRQRSRTLTATPDIRSEDEDGDDESVLKRQTTTGSSAGLGHAARKSALKTIPSSETASANTEVVVKSDSKPTTPLDTITNTSLSVAPTTPVTPVNSLPRPQKERNTGSIDSGLALQV